VLVIASVVFAARRTPRMLGAALGTATSAALLAAPVFVLGMGLSALLG